jgi:hypothetical protein
VFDAIFERIVLEMTGAPFSSQAVASGGALIRGLGSKANGRSQDTAPV